MLNLISSFSKKPKILGEAMLNLGKFHDRNLSEILQRTMLNLTDFFRKKPKNLQKKKAKFD